MATSAATHTAVAAPLQQVSPCPPSKPPTPQPSTTNARRGAPPATSTTLAPSTSAQVRRTAGAEIQVPIINVGGVVADKIHRSSNGLLGLGGTSSVSGPVGEHNCYICNGGGVGGGVAGACGNQTTSTIAIYARGF